MHGEPDNDLARELALDGDAMLPLPDDGAVWRVLHGEVEVYLVAPERRRLIALVGEGGYVFALPLQPTREVELLLAATAPARLLREAMPAPAMPTSAALAALPASAALAALPSPAALAASPTWAALAAGAANWVRLHGDDGALLAGANESARAHDAGALVAAMQAFTLGLDARFAAEALARDRATEGRLRRQDPSAAGDDWQDELIWLAEALGTGVGSGLARTAAAHAPAFDRLAAPIRARGLRARLVTLDADWPRRDAGPLLLRTADGHVQAAAWRRGGYRLRSGARLDAAAAAAYGREAWVLSAPFTRGTAGVLALARFCMPDILRAWLPFTVAALGLALTGVLMPLATASIVDDMVPTGAAGLLAATAIGLLAAALFGALFQVTQGLANARIDAAAGTRLSAALSDHVLRLPVSFYRGMPAGDLNQRLQSVEELRRLVTRTLLSSAVTLVLAVAYFALLFRYDARLAALGVLLTLVYAGAVALGRLLQTAPLREAAVLDGRLAGYTYELLDAIAKLRTSAAEGRALQRWTELYVRERAAAARGERIGMAFAAFDDAYATLRTMLLFAAALWLAHAGMSAGVFVAFLSGFGLFNANFAHLCEGLLDLFAGQPLAERARPVLAAATESAGGKADPGVLGGAVEMSGVVFGYDAGTAPLIDGLTFRLAPGEHLAIVGGSGSGKSTVLRLLLGFEHPTQGSIAYDGQELAHLDLTQVRGQIGVVLQTSMLFAGTVLENIRGASDASLEACLDAAEAAGLGADLKAMGMGIHTPITEGGGAFSGGQKQRILIARALAARPRILFFDEATSALDNSTQAQVAATLDALRATRITIAHRLSTVRNADRICVLEHGRFVEAGTFAELMALDGRFAALARRQLLKD